MNTITKIAIGFAITEFVGLVLMSERIHKSKEFAAELNGYLKGIDLAMNSEKGEA